MKTMVVTGGNRGIGMAVAQELTRLGHRVVVVARNEKQGEEAVRAMNQGAAGKAELLVGDLSSIKATQQTADAILEACPRLEVLIHNAGIWPTELELNEDGLEMSFAVNHIAPFLLNRRLEQRLRDSQARVVQVSAGIYVVARLDLEKTPTGADFSRFRTYPNTKLCNLMCTQRLARNWAETGITVNSVHPGVIRTGLGEGKGLQRMLVRLVKRLFGSLDRGAKGPVFLATAAEMEGKTGLYFDELKQQPLQPPAVDEKVTDALWAQAESILERHLA